MAAAAATARAMMRSVGLRGLRDASAAPARRLALPCAQCARTLRTRAAAPPPALPWRVVHLRSPPLAWRVARPRPPRARRGFASEAPGQPGAAVAEPTGPLRFVPEKIRIFTARYGFTFVAIYMSVYWMTIGAIYCGLRVGVMEPVHMMELAKRGVDTVGDKLGIPLSEWLHLQSMNPEAAPILAAWILSKPTEPVRAVFSVAVTPAISRRFRRFLASRNSASTGQKGALQCAPRAPPLLCSPPLPGWLAPDARLCAAATCCRSLRCVWSWS